MFKNSIKLVLLIIILGITITKSFAARDKKHPPKKYKSGRESAQNKYGSPQENDRRPDGMPYGIWNQEEFSKVLNQLRFGTPKEKSEAALRFGKAREKRATPHLIHELRDNSPAVMADIAEALGNIRDKRAIPALTLWLKKLEKTYKAKTYSKYNEFIVNTIYALGMIRDRSVSPILYKCLKAKYRRIREATISAFLMLKEANAIKHLRVASYVEQIYHVKRKMLRAIKVLSQKE